MDMCKEVTKIGVVVAGTLDLCQLPPKIQLALALLGGFLATPSSLARLVGHRAGGGDILKFKAALDAPRMVFLSKTLREQERQMMEFVNMCHMNHPGPSRWKFHFDEATFRARKAKPRATAADIGWFHKSELAAFADVKHAFDTDAQLVSQHTH